MKRSILILLLLSVSFLNYSQSWQKIKIAKNVQIPGKDTPTKFLKDTLERMQRLNRQRPFKDLDYDYGSEDTPAPREGALSWQDDSGKFWVFGGIGIDDDYNSGLFQDLWQYTPSNTTWKLVKGSRKVLLGRSDNAQDIPLPRRDAMTWVDKNGDLWLFGGRDYSDNLHYDDMWKFTAKSGIWSAISGTGKFNIKSKRGNKKKANTGDFPGSRSAASCWTDQSGAMWMFGGVSSGENGGEDDYYNDLWQFDSKKQQWAWISGEDKPNVKTKHGKKGKEDAQIIPSPRMKTAVWYDAAANKLWLYGGYGADTTGARGGGLADMWNYDIKKDVWTWISGTDALYSDSEYGIIDRETEISHPGYRYGAITWQDRSGNFWLYGGQNRLSGNSISINPFLWRFNMKSQRWANMTSPVTANITSGGCSFIDPDGGLMIFGGTKLDPYTLQTRPVNDIWKINTK